MGDSIAILFHFILILCISHYLFFSVWNFLKKPVTHHKFFEYNKRIEYVSNCFHKMNASICGDIPGELKNRVTGFPVLQGVCGGKYGILVGTSLSEQTTDFEALEKWCSHSL